VIEITNRAAAELKALMEDAGKSGSAIRIYITGTSSSGDAQYGLALADDINKFDVTTENNGIKLVMAAKVAIGFSDGSIDFVADKNGKNFIIQNAESGSCSNYDECNMCEAE
jgi:iron-sulfur cluster assembly accessory protein